MRNPRIVPWRDRQEWELVCSSLYSPDIEKKRFGVDRVKAWKCRGRLPHSIESTMNFVEALLMDQQENSVSLTQKRLLYGMIFVRFVNGVVDAEQKGQYAQSIAQIADSLGMPSFFVDLRHAATHDNMPSLSLLRSGARQALEWLYENYWQIQRNFVPETRAEMGRILKEYKTKRKNHLKTVEKTLLTSSIVDLNDSCLESINDLQRLVAQEHFSDLIVPVLVQVGSLIPETKSKRMSAIGPIPQNQLQIWAPLILNFRFIIQDLTMELVEMISKESLDPTISSTQTAWISWLLDQEFHVGILDSLLRAPNE